MIMFYNRKTLYLYKCKKYMKHAEGKNVFIESIDVE